MKKQSQNKANFREAQMNATIFATRDYENNSVLRLRENKPNQSQSQNRSQETENRKQKTGDGRQLIRPGYGEVLPPAGLKSYVSRFKRWGPVSKESISIRRHLAASRYTAAADGTANSNLKISAQLFDNCRAATTAMDMNRVATIVFANAWPMKQPIRLFPGTKQSSDSRQY